MGKNASGLAIQMLTNKMHSHIKVCTTTATGNTADLLVEMANPLLEADWKLELTGRNYSALILRENAAYFEH